MRPPACIQGPPPGAPHPLAGPEIRHSGSPEYPRNVGATGTTLCVKLLTHPHAPTTCCLGPPAGRVAEGLVRLDHGFEGHKPRLEVSSRDGAGAWTSGCERGRTGAGPLDLREREGAGTGSLGLREEGLDLWVRGRRRWGWTPEPAGGRRGRAPDWEGGRLGVFTPRS